MNVSSSATMLRTGGVTSGLTKSCCDGGGISSHNRAHWMLT
jgi:hypothetical protein